MAETKGLPEKTRKRKSKHTGTHPQYTREKKIEAIALVRHLGSVKAAARQLKISRGAITKWMEDTELHQESAEKIDKMEVSMMKRIESGMMVFFDQIMEQLHEKQYTRGQLLTGFGILADKVIALRKLQGDTDDFGEVRQWVRQLQDAHKRYGTPEPKEKPEEEPDAG